MIYKFACSNHETASNNVRQRSACAVSFMLSATGHVFDSSILSLVAEVAGAGPRSEMLTGFANTASAPAPGRRKSSSPFERLLIFGASFKIVSSEVTSALIIVESPLITAAFSRGAGRSRRKFIRFQRGKTKASNSINRKSIDWRRPVQRAAATAMASSRYSHNAFHFSKAPAHTQAVTINKAKGFFPFER